MPIKDRDKRLKYTLEWYYENRNRINAKKMKDRRNKKSALSIWNKEYKNRGKVKKYIKEYYEKNKEKFIDYAVKRRKKGKKEWLEILLSKGMLVCSICGYNKCFDAIDFHHKDPKTKEIMISKLMMYKPTPERIKELEKVVAVCANCHREIESKNHNQRWVSGGPRRFLN